MFWQEWLLVVAAAAVAYMTPSYFIYRKLIRRDHSTGDGLVDHSQPFFEPAWEWYKNVPKETVSIRSYDGVVLSAVYIPSLDKDSTVTAVLCHGFRGANADMAVIARMYSRMGFRILMPDARGHGLSKGKFTSFGHYERYDLKRWIQFLLRTYGATDSILLHGVSLGAATVILSSANDLPDNVKLLVADSPYNRSTSVIARSLKPKFLAFFLPGVSLLTYNLHRFCLGQADVLEAARASKIPLFLFHGEADPVCPLREAKKLFAAHGTEDKKFYPIPGAKHAEGYIADKDGVEREIAAFLQERFPLPKNLPTIKR